MSRPAAVGLTGGIASGKSTVALMFAKFDVPVLDLDHVGRELTQPGQPLLDKLVRTFGKKIVNGEGNLDRERLASVCFESEAKTRLLGSIMHPAIRQAEQGWLAKQNAVYALIEAVVLLESGGAKRMDALVVVLSDIELRRQRVLARGWPSLKRFGDIIARQCNDEERKKAADYILENNQDIAALQHRVEQIHVQLTQRFGRVDSHP